MDLVAADLELRAGKPVPVQVCVRVRVWGWGWGWCAGVRGRQCVLCVAP